MPTNALASEYQRHRRALAGVRLPCAYVDLDAVDRNSDLVFAPVERAGIKLRIATKSLRCWELYRYIAARGGGAVIGAMIFDASEIPLLSSRGVSDMILAYPTVQQADLDLIAEANARGSVVAVVADDERHLDGLADAALRSATTIPVLVDIDSSYRRAGGRVHLGVMRSPLRSADAAVAFAREISKRAGLRFHGVMAYEAHVAGFPDVPARRAMAPFHRGLKRLFVRDVRTLREETRAALTRAGFECRVFNGGGSGSVASTTLEAVVTEVTVGSGFAGSHLFDGYDAMPFAPALFFALQCVRRPAPGIVTCHGGGVHRLWARRSRSTAEAVSPCGCDVERSRRRRRSADASVARTECRCRDWRPGDLSPCESR